MSTIINATTTNGVVIQPDNSGSLQLQTNSGTTAVTIDTSQNVGIGTTSPSSILNVSAASPTILLTATTTTGTTIGNKNNRLLLASNSGTVNNGGEIVFAATDTDVDRWAAISGAIQSNSVSGCYGDILFATKATDAATTLTERMRITSDGLLKFNSGYGSVETAYGCRAWVNFNGTGTVAIRASGNVTSITDNGTGSYTVNITNAMPDANYSVVLSIKTPYTDANTNETLGRSSDSNPSTSSFRIYCNQLNSPSTAVDVPYVCAAVFR